MHLNSRLLIEKYARNYFADGLKVLEIGPDEFPSSVEKICRPSNCTWHTLDIEDNPRLTFKSSKEYEFDIQDEQYDIVISANVIEHVKKIWRWMPELSRVTKKGGRVITVNPVSWPYHAYPVDCWRIYPDGMTALYEDAGLEMEKSVFESIESVSLLNKPLNTSKMWPGPTLESRISVQKIKSFVGYPVTVAYDTISIGRKL